MRMLVLVVVAACSKGSAPPSGDEVHGGTVKPAAPAAPIAPPVAPAPPPRMRAGDNVGVTAPSPSNHADWVQPVHTVGWQRPDRARNSQEELFWGTWAATTGNYATRAAAMADKVMFTLEGSTKPDLVGKVVDAIASDSKLSTSCIWLELEADFTGIRRECALVNGEPSSLDQNDVLTGQKKDFGTRLEWYVDDKTNSVHVHFAADMLVPAAGKDGKLRQLVFRHWVLKLDKRVGDNTFTFVESFPEHDYTAPNRYAYLLAPHVFVGR